MKILILATHPLDTAPHQRFRFELFLPELERRGYQVTVSPALQVKALAVLHRPGRIAYKAFISLKAFLIRLGDIARSPAYDRVLIIREALPVGPPVIEWVLRRLGQRITYDFDDALWLDGAGPRPWFSRMAKCSWKTGAAIRMSRLVFAGNRFLADYARSFNENVMILPTVIDTDRYRPLRSAPSGIPVIGWMGSITTAPYLNLVRETLQELARRHRFKLHVVGDARFRMEGVDVEAKDWSLETELSDLACFDVGIMPLSDDPWSRGKCALKALQYMALEIPTVASPVGVNSEIIQDGINGFLASGSEEWVERLSRLLSDGELRKRLGRAGRRTVEAGYSVQAHAPRFADALEELKAV